MYKSKVDTIAALSTAPGRAAISVVRVSGPITLEIINKIFKPVGNRKFPTAFSVFYGTIIDPSSNLTVDKVLLSLFFAPNSYTGEDLAEISTHGNPLIVSKVLEIICASGARNAEAGEFTRRAFINGKMDLLDIEALSQLLAAETQPQLRIALNQLDGLPSAVFKQLRTTLIEELVLLEANLSFPEDAIESVDENKLSIKLSKILAELELILQNALRTSIVFSGLKIAFAGKPNTGKSSIMNRILKRDRSIVTEIPGTTRDTIEETINIHSIPIKLIDTAGIHSSEDIIESIGITRTKTALQEAFAIFAVFDSSQKTTPEDMQLLEDLASFDKPIIYLLNKSDLPQQIDTKYFDAKNYVFISSITGAGYDILLDKVLQLLDKQGTDCFEQMIILGVRQTQCLTNAIEALKRATDKTHKLYQDMIAIEIEEAVNELGRITGEKVDLNTLDLIFERFCIGK